MPQENEPALTRRKLIQVAGTAAITGCLSQETDKNIEVPSGIQNEENYVSLINQLQNQEDFEHETLLNTLDINQQNPSEQGINILQSLVIQEPAPDTVSLAKKIHDYGEQSGKINTPQARVLSTAPISSQEYINGVLEGNLQTSSEYQGLTQFEENFFQLNGFQNDTIETEYKELLEILSENGYTEEEINYLRIAADYGSERIGDDPRIQQARQNNLWLPEIQTTEVDTQILNNFRDFDQDQTINAVDPDTEVSTATKDVFTGRIIEEVFQGDPEQIYVPIIFEKTQNVEKSDYRQSINFVGDKLAEKGINLIGIEGKTDIPTIEDKQRLEDLVVPPSGERINEYLGLGAHYMLFANEATNYAGLNWDTAPNLPETGYTDNKHDLNHTKYTLGHELAAMLGGRGLDHLNAAATEINSQAGRESFQSYVYDYENMRFADVDVEAMEESNFNLGKLRNGQIAETIPMDILQNLAGNRTSLDNAYDIIYQSNTGLETVT